MGLGKKLSWSLAQRGWTGTARAAVSAMSRLTRRPGREAVVHPFDERMGVETSGLISGGELATGHAHDRYVTAYAAIAPSRFAEAIERWSELTGNKQLEEWAFVDLGCGKGRALLLASERAFREVAGVELNPRLAQAAMQNVQRWVSAGRARSPVRVVEGDVLSLELPDAPTMLFLYNSFAGPLVRKIAEQISVHVRERGGPVDVIYQNAEWGAELTACGWREVWRGRLALSSEDAAVDPVASAEDVTAI
ncbi:MAG TPA: class I SAM-dependent methyltransferase, partial [Acidobacteriaceae bacterium]